MSTNRQTFLNRRPTLAAPLRRVVGRNLDDLRTSTCSLVRKNEQEPAPRRIVDTFCKTVAFYHPGDSQRCNRNAGVVGGRGWCGLEVTVSALADNLQMRLRHASRRRKAALAAKKAASAVALFPPQGCLRLLEIARVFHGISIAVGQKDRQANITADCGARVGGRRLAALFPWFELAHEKSIPVPIGPFDQMAGLGRTLNGPMAFDRDTPTRQGRGAQQSPIQFKVYRVLAQRDRMPAIRGFEAWESDMQPLFFAAQVAFECLSSLSARIWTVLVGTLPLPQPAKDFVRAYLKANLPVSWEVCFV